MSEEHVDPPKRKVYARKRLMQKLQKTINDMNTLKKDLENFSCNDGAVSKSLNDLNKALIHAYKLIGKKYRTEDANKKVKMVPCLSSKNKNDNKSKKNPLK